MEKQNEQNSKIPEWTENNELLLPMCKLAIEEKEKMDSVTMYFPASITIEWNKESTTDNKMKAMHSVFNLFQQMSALIQLIGDKHERSNVTIVSPSAMNKLHS